MKGYINHRMVRHFNNGAYRIDQIHLDKTKFKWTLKNPCKICLVKACCSKTREFSCDDIICHEITWLKISRIFKSYICAPMFCFLAILIFHFGSEYIRGNHLSKTKIIIMYITLTCVTALPVIRFLIWLLNGKEPYERL